MKTGLMFIFVSLVLTLALPGSARANPNLDTTPHSCEPSNVTAKFQDVTVHYSCFSGSAFTQSQQALFGEQIMIFAGGISSHGSDTPAIRILFSADPSCRFATGTTMELSNSCLLISDSSTWTLPDSAHGYTSGCSWKGHRMALKGECLTGGATNKTSGSITITSWPSAPPVQGFGVIAFRFSPDANVTGFYMKKAPGQNWFNPVMFPIAVPLAGSATMKVSY